MRVEEVDKLLNTLLDGYDLTSSLMSVEDSRDHQIGVLVFLEARGADLVHNLSCKKLPAEFARVCVLLLSQTLDLGFLTRHGSFMLSLRLLFRWERKKFHFLAKKILADLFDELIGVLIALFVRVEKICGLQGVGLRDFYNVKGLLSLIRSLLKSSFRGLGLLCPLYGFPDGDFLNVIEDLDLNFLPEEFFLIQGLSVIAKSILFILFSLVLVFFCSSLICLFFLLALDLLFFSRLFRFFFIFGGPLFFCFFLFGLFSVLRLILRGLFIGAIFEESPEDFVVLSHARLVLNLALKSVISVLILFFRVVRHYSSFRVEIRRSPVHRQQGVGLVPL